MVLAQCDFLLDLGRVFRSVITSAEWNWKTFEKNYGLEYYAT